VPTCSPPGLPVGRAPRQGRSAESVVVPGLRGEGPLGPRSQAPGPEARPSDSVWGWGDETVGLRAGGWDLRGGLF
jgi:hypothetical protein